MNIWIVGGNVEMRELWGNLLSNSLPSSTVIICINTKWFLNRDLMEQDIVFCLTVELDEKVLSIIKQSISSCVPVLCITENISEETYEKLVRIGVKGVLNSNRASLDTIKTAIRIVKDGGIYIESPKNYKIPFSKVIRSTLVRPSLNMTEWDVFSLTSKGLMVEEIAISLDITVDDTLMYQRNIIEKTNCKTLPGAVASGLNRGWFSDKEKKI